jgi:hypothetical protein
MTHSALPYQRTWSGNPDVDEALARLYALDDLPVSAHAAVYEDVHESLRATLDDRSAAAPRPANGS